VVTIASAATRIAATIAYAPSPTSGRTLTERGGQGLIVGAPAVSDALTQGTPTAGYSLASRDTVADCFEIGHYAHHGDAMIVISGCDKTGAAALMPLARTNAFGLVLYPGTSTPGRVSFGAWAARPTTSPSWITPRPAPPRVPSVRRGASESSATSCRAAAPAAACSPPTP
jgi:dihydroxy-acid dehydratase